MSNRAIHAAALVAGLKASGVPVDAVATRADRSRGSRRDAERRTG